ncbi:MAG: MFS transporter [Deltaproteobacteria bacterium]|nr:MFS transporter [Deltaproteobacteria bacterium]
MAIIYIAFVGLGLPDTVLGAVWPSVQSQFDLPLDAAGQAVLLTMLGVTASSLMTGRLIERFGTGAILVASSLLASSALFANAGAPGWAFMLVAAVAAGLAGGAIDTALNAFVARNYSARHMNWLHGFWGVGATLGPLLAALALRQTGTWRTAYAILGGVEFALGILFVVTLPRWRAASGSALGKGTDVNAPASGNAAAAAFPLGRPSLTRAARAGVGLFGIYGALEASIGLWSASFLVATRGVTPAAAGAAVAVYWGGLTAGRLLLGILATTGNELRLVRAGLWTVFPSLLILSITSLPFAFAVIALGVLGAALGPIYPTLMHDTPRRFGQDAATRLVGYQVAACSAGVATLPWLVGITARATAVSLLPLCLAVLAGLALALEQARRRQDLLDHAV